MNTRANKDATQRSFEKETARAEREEDSARGDEDRRSVLGAPVDPNSPTTKGNFPPGLPAQDAVDPGRATPGGVPVDNRSGRSEDEAPPRRK